MIENICILYICVKYWIDASNDQWLQATMTWKYYFSYEENSKKRQQTRKHVQQNNNSTTCTRLEEESIKARCM